MDKCTCLVVLFATLMRFAMGWCLKLYWTFCQATQFQTLTVRSLPDCLPELERDNGLIVPTSKGNHSGIPIHRICVPYTCPVLGCLVSTQSMFALFPYATALGVSEQRRSPSRHHTGQHVDSYKWWLCWWWPWKSGREQEIWVLRWSICCTLRCWPLIRLCLLQLSRLWFCGVDKGLPVKICRFWRHYFAVLYQCLFLHLSTSIH